MVLLTMFVLVAPVVTLGLLLRWLTRLIRRSRKATPLAHRAPGACPHRSRPAPPQPAVRADRRWPLPEVTFTQRARRPGRRTTERSADPHLAGSR
jgi:hypothetical protein